MKKNCIFLLAAFLLLSVIETSVFAQSERPNRKELLAEVGDPDSFRDNVRFLGLAVTGFVILDPTCVFPPGEELGPDDRCIVLNPAPAVTNFDVRDIGRITFPSNSAKSLIYPLFMHNLNYQFLNTIGATQPNALFNYQPYITIESEALNDPRAVDPETGLPLNGKLDVSFPGRAVNRSLAVDERAREALNYSRGGIGGLSKGVFLFNFGLPEDIVNRMFRKPITIRLNMRGSARHVSDGFLFYGIRFMGN